MNTKHSPLPWRGDRNIYGADNTVVCTNNRPAGGQIAVENANRDLILRAVNCHQALVEAVKSLLIAVDGYAGTAEPLMYNAVETQARAARAQAEAKP
jgi:hypothetical protein